MLHRNVSSMKRNLSGLNLSDLSIIASSFVLVCLCILVSVTSGSDSYSTVNMNEPFHEFTTTNSSANFSSDPAYRITPTPIGIQFELNETGLPAPKGEMAAGPRIIGISADLVTVVLVSAALVVTLSGVWYLARRKVKEKEPEENDDDGQ